MTSIPQTSQGSIPRQILEEAADWFVEFRVDEINGAARERFDCWLRQSPQHVQAYLDIATTYAGLPAGRTPIELDINELIARAQSVPVADVVPLAIPSPPGPVRNRTPRRLRLAAVAAAAVAMAGLLGWLGWRNRGVYSTDIDQERAITLADGSIVELNARSQIRVRFSKTERRVDLVKGEAFFIVAKNPDYPFIVHSRDLAVRDVGTEFDINRQITRTVVTVLEGRIEMLAGNDARARVTGPAAAAPFSKRGGMLSVLHFGEMPASEPVVVSAGQEMIVTYDGARSVPQRADLAEVTAWRRHRLIFDSSPLVDVVDEFNRYNRHQLVIASPQLDGLQISGVYSSTNPGSFVRFLQAQPDIEVTEADGTMRISQRGSN